jgi:hypothetical protein
MDGWIIACSRFCACVRESAFGGFPSHSGDWTTFFASRYPDSSKEGRKEVNMKAGTAVASSLKDP